MAFFSTSSISKAFAKVSPNLATMSGMYRMLWVLEQNTESQSHQVCPLATWQWEIAFSLWTAPVSGDEEGETKHLCMGSPFLTKKNTHLLGTRRRLHFAQRLPAAPHNSYPQFTSFSALWNAGCNAQEKATVRRRPHNPQASHVSSKILCSHWLAEERLPHLWNTHTAPLRMGHSP